MTDLTPPGGPCESKLQVDVRRAICVRIERMVGYPPTGFDDLLKILTHPDVIDLTRMLVDSYLTTEERGCT